MSQGFGNARASGWATSIKTRIETLEQLPVLSAWLPAGGRLPLKQGLKHGVGGTFAADADAGGRLPLKQGLKRLR